MDLSLNRIARLVSALPKYTRPTFHVAGTNGKGSVTVLVDSMLREAGYTTGRFNSPHLVTVRDSISINGYAISAAAYNKARCAVVEADKDMECHATSFELLTATALYAFEDAKVDAAVLEVGLGGRLDATNVLPKDIVVTCGISVIDLDHQAILGNSVDEIAREKAGIAKQGIPCIVASQSHASALKALQETIEGNGGEFIPALPSRVAPMSVREEDCLSSATVRPLPATIIVETQKSHFGAKLNLAGDHQLGNVSLAVGMVEAAVKRGYFSRICEEEMSRGIEKARWPGRLDWIKLPNSERHILVDGAHNTSSATTLSHYLQSTFVPRPIQFIISLSHSPPKTALQVLAPFLQRGDDVIIVPFTEVEDMPWVRPVESVSVAEAAKTLVGEEGNVEIFETLDVALKSVLPNERTIVVSGSLYLVSDLYRLLEVWESRNIGSEEFVGS
jgi:folylpolyglutamate synthase/dihydrofolate synthase